MINPAQRVKCEKCGEEYWTFHSEKICIDCMKSLGVYDYFRKKWNKEVEEKNKRLRYYYR